MAIGSFGDELAEKFFWIEVAPENEKNLSFSKRDGQRLTQSDQRRIAKILFTLSNAETVEEFRERRPYQFHPLKHNKKGFYSMDINRTSGYRIVFKYEHGKFHVVSIDLDHHE